MHVFADPITYTPYVIFKRGLLCSKLRISGDLLFSFLDSSPGNVEDEIRTHQDDMRILMDDIKRKEEDIKRKEE